MSNPFYLIPFSFWFFDFLAIVHLVYPHSRVQSHSSSKHKHGFARYRRCSLDSYPETEVVSVWFAFEMDRYHGFKNAFLKSTSGFKFAICTPFHFLFYFLHSTTLRSGPAQFNLLGFFFLVTLLSSFSALILCSTTIVMCSDMAKQIKRLRLCGPCVFCVNPKDEWWKNDKWIVGLCPFVFRFKYGLNVYSPWPCTPSSLLLPVGRRRPMFAAL